MKLNVNVTQCDIDHGCIGDGSRCPIARALIRALTDRGFRWVGMAVGTSTIRLDALGRGMIYVPSTTQLADFIGKFDHKLMVSPFSFELDIPWADPNPGIPVPADMMAVAVKETVCESK